MGTDMGLPQGATETTVKTMDEILSETHNVIITNQSNKTVWIFY